MNTKYNKYNKNYNVKELADDLLVNLLSKSERIKNKFIINDIRLFYKALKKYDIKMYQFLLYDSEEKPKNIIIFTENTNNLKNAFVQYKDYLESKQIRNKINNLKLMRTKESIIINDKKESKIDKNNLDNITKEIQNKYLNENQFQKERRVDERL